MNIPPPGDYIAKTNGQIIVGETEKGALMAEVPYVISQGDHAGYSDRAMVCIVKKDGTILSNTVDNLKAAFGWDGADPFWLSYEDAGMAQPRQGFPDIEFKLSQCVHEEHEGKTRFKVGWLNPLGGGSWLEPADRKSVLAKYGSKFRALSGGATPKPAATTTAKAAPAKLAPPAAPKKSTPPPAPTGPTSTMEECWEELCKANEGKSQDDLSALWFATLKQEFNTDNNSDITLHQWGQLKEKLKGDYVPM